MSTKEESEINGCSICMNEETKGSNGCISPSDEPFGTDPASRGCIHYACRECWKQAKRLNNKCFVCMKELPEGFITQTNDEILQDWIEDQDPLSVTELYLSSNKIVDLSPLAFLTNLTMLYLSGNQISDLTPLASLTNLTKLYLGYNHIVDKTQLSSLNNTLISY
jgi:Leucine-rich repeat (LRR) protein